MKKERVLVIDDEPTVRRTIRRTLDGPHCEVLTAQDGPEGLAMVHAHKPNLVIVDVRMPGMDGYAVCAELQNDPFTSGIPILMLSGLSSPAHVISGLSFGADSYVTKPFDADELRARVHRMLIRSRYFAYAK